jgi:hypothetical protein
MAAAGCGSNAPPPTAPTPPSVGATVLSIGGQAILNIGLTSQLTARTPDGTTLSGVTWTSATPAVATVTSDGLVRAVAEGTTTITATAPSVNGRGSVTVLVQQSGSSTVVLTACGSLTSPGRYVVDRDIPANNSVCFTMSSVAGLQLDCLGHSMRGIVIEHTSGTTVVNCMVEGSITIASSSDVTVSGSTITNGFLYAAQSTNVTIAGNTVGNTGNAGSGGLVVLSGGSNNHVTHNTLNGGYDGSRADVGVDDGIIVLNESGDAIEDNSIRSVYDAGIEGVGVVTGTRLTNNTMTNLGFAGVGSYWCTAWTNNTVQGNSVTSAPRLVTIVYSTGPKCGATIVPPAFSGNQFVGNVFRNPVSGTLITIRRAAVLIDMPGLVQGNLIQGNDLGAADGPFLSPLDGFIDGGGNQCGPFSSTFSNFVCAPPAALRQWGKGAVRQ